MLTDEQKKFLDGLLYQDVYEYYQETHKVKMDSLRKRRVYDVIKELEKIYPNTVIYSIFGVILKCNRRTKRQLYNSLEQFSDVIERNSDKVLIICDQDHLDGHNSPYLSYCFVEIEKMETLK
jgi:hypothetical protein